MASVCLQSVIGNSLPFSIRPRPFYMYSRLFRSFLICSCHTVSWFVNKANCHMASVLSCKTLINTLKKYLRKLTYQETFYWFENENPTNTTQKNKIRDIFGNIFGEITVTKYIKTLWKARSFGTKVRLWVHLGRSVSVGRNRKEYQAEFWLGSKYGIQKEETLVTKICL